MYVNNIGSHSRRSAYALRDGVWARRQEGWNLTFAERIVTPKGALPLAACDANATREGP